MSTDFKQRQWEEGRARDCALEAAAMLNRGGLSDNERAAVVVLLALALLHTAKSDNVNAAAADIAIDYVQSKSATAAQTGEFPA